MPTSNESLLAPTARCRAIVTGVQPTPQGERVVEPVGAETGAPRQRPCGIGASRCSTRHCVVLDIEAHVDHLKEPRDVKHFPNSGIKKILEKRWPCCFEVECRRLLN